MKQRNPWAWGEPYVEPPAGSVVKKLAITSPLDGTILANELYAIYGEGAEAGAEVELWSQDRDPDADTPNATVTADENGYFAFDGNTPAATGVDTWIVTSGGAVSAPVTVRLVDTTPEPEPEPEPDPEEPVEEGTEEPVEGEAVDRPWASRTTHATVDEAVPDWVALPDDWDSLTIAGKKAWLDANAV